IHEVEGSSFYDSNDATIIEFDFVSFANNVSFNFLFTSNEYGQYQCDYSDVFAFFLTDSDDNTENLAVVPGTTTPVSVTTIRDSQYNTGFDNCPSANVEYFDKYYGAGGEPETEAPVNTKGNTVKMTAEAEVTPGETYHMKLAIGNRGDHSFDSAVFLEAGSFDVGGVDLGPDITIDSGTAVCVGQEALLDSGMEAIDGMTFTWYKDGEVIDGAEDSTYLATEEGEYTVEVDIDFISGDCVPDDTVIVEFLPTPDLDDVGEPGDITACVAAGGSYSFDLTENDDTILNEYDPEDYVITYHTTEEDAEEGENAIEDPENHVAECDTIWTRIAGFANAE